MKLTSDENTIYIVSLTWENNEFTTTVPRYLLLVVRHDEYSPNSQEKVKSSERFDKISLYLVLCFRCPLILF